MEALLTATACDYSPGMAILNEPGLTDEAHWIRRARHADVRAFESLYRMHVDKVYGLCLRMTGNVAEAEDCTQDAFIRAWKQIGKFRGESAFGTWLHRIAVNCVLGGMRKSRRERERIPPSTQLTAIRCSQVPKALSPRNLPICFHARINASCVQSSASATLPVMRRHRP